MTRLTSVVKRGKRVGSIQTPHRYPSGHFVISLTRFVRDEVNVPREDDLEKWVALGYSVRMSDQASPVTIRPSLICPASMA